MDNELNKKLAEWVGFKEADIKKHYYFVVGGERLPKWQEPGRDWHIKLPDFTQSLDACFEWLVPKLEEDGWDWHLTSNRIVLQKGNSYYEICYSDHNPALALCLAIEKLIDEESK